MPSVLKMPFDIAVASLLYLVPGYLLMEWIYFPALRGLNRFLVALSISLVIVPTSFITVGNLVRFQPGLWPWLALVLILAFGALVLHRRRRRPHLGIVMRGQDIRSPSRLEHLGVVAFLALFAAAVNVPRLLMFFQGSQAMELGPWDETWHIQQLVSVARNGIPPTHYFFPSVDLGYYYGSWIYPAILGNLPLSPVSLMRAMSMHAYLQTFAFLGIIYLLFQFNLRFPWARLAGVAFFTSMGGFDLFARQPAVDNIEFWLRDPGWLSGSAIMQISQFSTLYTWVPQHLAGGMVVVLMILLYVSIDSPIWLKLICTGVLSGFFLTTSPFVFIGLCVAVGLVAFWKLPWWWQNRAVAFLGIALAAVAFTLIAWFPISVYAQHGGTLAASDMRITLIERFRGQNPVNYLADRSLTLLGLPLVGGSLLIVDMGLMFVLYAVWWGRRLFSAGPLFRSAEDLILGLQPLASLVVVFMIMDLGGGSNVMMRGMITAQVLMVLAGTLALDWLIVLVQNTGNKRFILPYVFVCFLLAQSASTLAELRTTSKKVLEIAAWDECGAMASLMESFDANYCLPKDPYRYVYWLNNHTPPDSLVVEEGPFPPDSVRYRWLERARFLIPRATESLSLWPYDASFVLPAQWQRLAQEGGGYTSVLEWYRAVDFPGKGQHPAYLVTRQEGQEALAADQPVYQDDYVKVYSLGVFGAAR